LVGGLHINTYKYLKLFSNQTGCSL